MSGFDELDNVNEWLTRYFSQFSSNPKLTYKAEITFGELMMNTFEHGNLGITIQEKHHLIKTGDYYEYLKERSKTSQKQIVVSLGSFEYGGKLYVSVVI